MGLDAYIAFAAISIVTVLGAWLTAKSSGAKQVTEGALILLEPLKTRILDLETRMETLEAENRLLRLWGEHNYAIAVEAGGDPPSFRRFTKGPPP